MIILRSSQATAFAALRGEQYSILNAPTGWGKSLCLTAIAGEGDGRKLVVAIPQRAIAKGFARSLAIRLPSGQVVNWRVDLDLCSPAAAKIRQLQEFLLSPPPAVGRRVALTTHHSLALAWHGLHVECHSQVARDLTLVVDEAHHLQAGDRDANRLGAAIDDLIATGQESLRLILATAFFFRGDGLPILDATKVDLFRRYSVALDEYWTSLRHIKTYSYDFVAFKGTVLPDLSKLLKTSQEPTILYLPREGHRLHLGQSKRSTVAEVVKLLRENEPKSDLWTPGTTKGRRIIDLVSTAHRSDKLSFVANHPEKVTAILAVGMFREGADWPRASRVLDLVPTGSDQDRGQRFGRLIRDYEGKNHISYYSFLPYFPNASAEERRLQFSRLFAHFHASLVLENSLRPIRTPSNRKPKKNEAKEEATDYLGQLDAKTQREVIGQCYEELINLAAKGDVVSDDAEAVIVGVLAGAGIDADWHSPMARQIAALMRRRQNHELDCDDLIKSGFDKIWHQEILDGVLVFTAGLGGPDTFAEVRAAITGAFESRWQSNFEKVRQLKTRPECDTSAYNWCTHNRTLRSRGELAEDKAALLELLPWWTWTIGVADRWQTRFAAISSMVKAPQSGTQDYDWVRQQRLMHSQGKLSAERVQACQTIPWWTWGGWSDKWAEAHDRISKLPARPTAPSDDYEWVKYQRKRKAQGKLSAERVQACQAIPWWVW